MKLIHRNCIATIALLLSAVVVNGQLPEEVVSVPLPGVTPRIDRSLRRQPLAFEPNVGQTDPEVKFLARGKGYQLFLTEREAVMVLHARAFGADAQVSARRQRFDSSPALGSILKAPEGRRTPKPGGDLLAPIESATNLDSHVLRMRLAGARASFPVRGQNELRGKVSYFVGNDPARWRTNVPTFGQVRLAEVYPGIDLVYHGKEGQLEYDFVLAPGADPNQIAMEFEGAERLELDAHGDLIAWVGGCAVSWRRPVVYQESDDQRIEIAGGYRLNKTSLTYQAEAPSRIGFELAAYDPAKPLVIDPALVYSTYLGGGGIDRPNYGTSRAIAADSQGNACVVGNTDSLNFPVKNALQSQPGGGGDVFVTKLSRSGELLFSTYLGGQGGDWVSGGVAVDTAGRIYVAGGTYSTNFPLVNPLQSTFAGGLTDAFVAILSPDGAAISFSTYWGGAVDDGFDGVALDPAGNIYLAGSSGDSSGAVINDFPVHNALQAQPAGGGDAVVVKLEAGGKGVIYSTFFGGSGGERASAIAADAEGFAYIVGTTTSYDLPVLNAYQPSITGDLSVVGTPYSDLFYARITPDGSELVYSSYFGSYGPDDYSALALGPHGELWLAGRTALSEGLATAGSFQTSLLPDSQGGIVARFNAANGALVAATYLQNGLCSSIAVDVSGGVWVGGAASHGLALVDPLEPGKPDNGDVDAFVAKLSSDCSRLLFSTFFGGPSRDAGYGLSLCLDPDGNVLLFGDTESKTNFPLVNAFQTNLNGSADAFVAKISLSEVLKISRTGQTLSLSWPASATNFILEATTSLPAVSWTMVTNTPTVSATERRVQLLVTGNAGFFRLRKQ